MHLRPLLPTLSLLLLTACFSPESDETAEEACRDQACPAVFIPPVSLELRAAEGRTLSGVTVTGASVSCSPESGPTVSCIVTEGVARTYALTVSAPGYAPLRLSATATEVSRTACTCCTPGYAPQRLSVELVPAP